MEFSFLAGHAGDYEIGIKNARRRDSRPALLFTAGNYNELPHANCGTGRAGVAVGEARKVKESNAK
jgi:hypothetical protein